MEKKHYLITCGVALIAVLATANVMQYAASKNADKPKEKPVVTYALLSGEEIVEGKEILAEAKKLAVTREAAAKVINDTAKKDSKTELAAHKDWWAATKSLDDLQGRVNKLIARAQERTGCANCGIDIDKGTLGVAPTPTPTK